MSAAENLILTITSKGAGKLISSHDYPVRGRSGQGRSRFDVRIEVDVRVDATDVGVGVAAEQDEEHHEGATDDG